MSSTATYAETETDLKVVTSGRISPLLDTGANTPSWFSEVDRALTVLIHLRWKDIKHIDCVNIYKFDTSLFPTQVALICPLADLNRILFDVQKENENNGHRNNKPAAGVPFPGLADVTDILTRVFELTEILAAGQQNAAEKTKLLKELRSLNARSAQAQPKPTSVVFEKPYSHYASLSIPMTNRHWTYGLHNVTTLLQKRCLMHHLGASNPRFMLPMKKYSLL